MTENEQKYGEKQKDVISDLFGLTNNHTNLGNIAGPSFALGNVMKYVRRYTSDSEKALLITDIKKARDYTLRAKEKVFHSEYDRLIDLINKFEFDTAYKLAKIMLGEILSNEIQKYAK